MKAKYIILAVVVFCLTIILSDSVDIAMFYSIGVPIIISLLLGYIFIPAMTRKKQEKAFLLKVFFGAFLVRIFIIFLYYFILNLDLPSGSVFLRPRGDEPFYDHMSYEIASSWNGPLVDIPAFSSFWGNYLPPVQYPDELSKGTIPGFIYFNALCYFLFGRNPLVPRIFNSFFGALIPIFVFFLAKILSKNSFEINKISKLAVLLAVFAPDLVYFSIAQLKDIIIVLISTIILWLSVEPKLNYKRKYFWLSFCLLLLYFLRPQYAFIYVIIIIFSLLFIEYKKLMTFTRLIYIFIFGGLFLSGIYLYNYYSVTNLTSLATPDALLYNRILLRTVQSPLPFYQIDNTIINRIIFLPFFILMALLRPFPLWVFSNPSFYNLGNLSISIFWFALLPFALYGYFFLLRRTLKEYFVIYSTIACIIIITSFTYLSHFEPERYRLPIIPALYIFAAFTIKDRSYPTHYLRFVKLIYLLFIIVIFLLYIFLVLF